MANDLKQKREGNYHHKGNPKHGLYRQYPHLFNLWQTMKARCENENRESYSRYGGRGISLCKEWGKAESFVLWALQNGYRKGLQIDRKDNEKGYSPENCRFVTAKENNRNRRNNKLLTIDGITKCVSEWSEFVGVSKYTIYDWARKHGKEYAEGRIAKAWNRRVTDGEKAD